jgi:hypothetical protein
VEELCRGYVNEPHHQLMDLSKAKADLGYRDVVPALEAVRRTVQWNLDNRKWLEGMIEAQNKDDRLKGDPYAYELEDRLVALNRDFSNQVTAAIPSLGRRRDPS